METSLPTRGLKNGVKSSHVLTGPWSIGGQSGLSKNPTRSPDEPNPKRNPEPNPKRKPKRKPKTKAMEAALRGLRAQGPGSPAGPHWRATKPEAARRARFTDQETMHYAEELSKTQSDTPKDA